MCNVVIVFVTLFLLWSEKNWGADEQHHPFCKRMDLCMLLEADSNTGNSSQNGRCFLGKKTTMSKSLLHELYLDIPTWLEIQKADFKDCLFKSNVSNIRLMKVITLL